MTNVWEFCFWKKYVLFSVRISLCHSSPWNWFRNSEGKCCGNELSLPSFTFSRNDAVTITIVSSEFLVLLWSKFIDQSSAIYIARQGMRIFCGTSEFFYLLLGWPTANFALLLRGQSHQLNVNNCMFDSLIWSKSHMEPRNEVGSQSLAKHLVGFEPRTFWFWM